MTRYVACLLLAAAALCAAADRFPVREADAAIEQAIEDELIPGAVLLVWHDGRVVHREAYGNRAVTPTREPMTVDTIFDAASLTKLITSTALMQLFEQGKVRLNDPVTEYLPRFQSGESRITVRHLVTHFSGLRADLDLQPAWSGYETGAQKALIDKPVAEAGEEFHYSDINYILVAEIVRALSGERIDEYAREHIFGQLGMRDTMFNPPERLLPRIAPTEVVEPGGEPLRGVVHDPTTRYMGGVAGHAGMFTTADDLARFARMILGKGELRGERILEPLTVRKMTEPQSPADQPVLRGVGWDIDSVYSGNRGELLPLGSYGHTGFTGTSLWIDPRTETIVILMTNRVHPYDRGSITSLRSRVATAVAAATGIDLPGVILTGYNETLARGARRPVARTGEALTGLDVLAADGFARLRGRRVGLITNHTGLDRDGARNIDLMLDAGVELTAILSPEHGLSGDREGGASIADSRDEKTGVPIWSLYSGTGRRPTGEMLRGIDVLVFDIQDVGARFYTYMCTMLDAMEEAERRGILFMVLDRPNPITGVHVEGPMLDAGNESFVGCLSLPIRHGMTLGELARMANAEREIGVRLEVVRMKGWQRGDWFDSTDLVWVNPSPNMRSLNAALLYPGVAMLEGSSNYSVGRGTDSPFEQIGAEWIVGRELASYLNTRRIPGIRVYPTRFRPQSPPLAGRLLDGVRFVITDRDAFNSTRLGMELAAAIRHLYPGNVDWESNRRLIGDEDTITGIEEGDDPRDIGEEHRAELESFLERRSRYLLY